MIRARFVLPLALGALGSCCALADELILLPSKDNTINSEDATFGGATSNGAGPHMFVGQTSFAGVRRALVQFDVTSIPAAAQIDGVSLSFNVTRGHGTQSITLHRLLTDWGEGASNSGDFSGGRLAPAQDGDATWFYHHYFTDGSSQPWNTPGGDFVQVESASGTAAATTFVLTSPTMTTDVQQWIAGAFGNFGWLLLGQEDLSGAADRLDTKENSDPNFRPMLIVDYSMPGPTQWNIDADGSWNNPDNWSDHSVPNSPTAVLALSDKITAPRTITLDAPITIGTMTISSFNKYTIAPGLGGSLTLGGPGAPGAININSATHEISAKVIVAGPSTLNVPGDGRLILSGGLQINSATPLLMTGDGDLTLAGPQTHQSGASLTINNARLLTNSNAGAPAAPATPASAPLSITLSGGSGVFMSTLTLGASQDLNSLTINTGDEGIQAVDLNSTETEFHSLRIHGGDLTAAKSSLNLAIQQGKTTGEGIFDSGLRPGAAIGIASLTDAHGEPYVLVRPTRVGDLNLDGAVTISDFIDLASHFNSPGDWQSGDLNADGLVTISDFIDLASNFNTTYTGAMLPLNPADQLMLASFAQAHGATLVPEPGSLMPLFASAFLLKRRRK
jgi:hypothetical protein